MQNINVSFVIPNKNQTELLEKCVASIPKRSDVEIIIVDDASDPDLVDFNNYPASSDPRTKILYVSKEETKGNGNARNIGMSAAVGKWIMFADADDYYETDALNSFIEKYIDADYDIVYFGIQLVKYTADGTNPFIKYGNICKYIKKFREEKNAETDSDMRYATWSPVPKIMKLSFLRDNNIFFPCVTAGPDVIFSLESGHAAKKIQAEDVILYNYVIRQDSVTRKWSEKKCDDQFFVLLKHHELCREYGYKKYNYPIIFYIIHSANKCGMRKIPEYLSVCKKRKFNPFKGIIRYFFKSTM